MLFILAIILANIFIIMMSCAERYDNFMNKYYLAHHGYDALPLRQADIDILEKVV